MKVRIKKLRENAIIPKYQTSGAAGFDFHATERVTIRPYNFAIIPSGIAMELPEGYELQIRGRSGLAFKHNVHSFNGTIDFDYRGEINMLLVNHGDEFFTVNAGDRVAQGIIAPIVQAEFELTDNLSETDRNEDGFGSTGK